MPKKKRKNKKKAAATKAESNEGSLAANGTPGVPGVDVEDGDIEEDELDSPTVREGQIEFMTQLTVSSRRHLQTTMGRSKKSRALSPLPRTQIQRQRIQQPRRTAPMIRPQSTKNG